MMWMQKGKSKSDILRQYDRAMLRSAFVSLFWNVMKIKKISQQKLADAIGVHKSAPSRWFSNERPNWEVDTIADIADVLDLTIEVRAIDRKTGVIYASYGVIKPIVKTATRPLPRFNLRTTGVVDPQRTFTEPRVDSIPVAA